MRRTDDGTRGGRGRHGMWWYAGLAACILWGSARPALAADPPPGTMAPTRPVDGRPGVGPGVAPGVGPGVGPGDSLGGAQPGGISGLPATGALAPGSGARGPFVASPEPPLIGAPAGTGAAGLPPPALPATPEHLGRNTAPGLDRYNAPGTYATPESPRTEIPSAPVPTLPTSPTPLR